MPQKIINRLGLLRPIYRLEVQDDGVMRSHVEIVLEQDDESLEIFKIWGHLIYDQNESKESVAG